AAMRPRAAAARGLQDGPPMRSNSVADVRRTPRPMNVVAIRLSLDTVKACLAHLLCECRLVAARHVQQTCDRLRGGDIDLVVANGGLPFWDVHVLEQITRLHGTELLLLDEKRWPEDLAPWIDGVRARRARHLRRA